MSKQEKLRLCKALEAHAWTCGHAIAFAGQRQCCLVSLLHAVESSGSGYGVVKTARAPKSLSPGKVGLMIDSALQMSESFRSEGSRINTSARAEAVYVTLVQRRTSEIEGF